MSDSPSSTDTPSDAPLEKALRHAVQLVYRNGNLEELTVKRIRLFVEKDLGLQDEFFKNDAKWKARSKDIIQREVEAHAEPEKSSPIPSPKKVHKPPPRPQDQHRKLQTRKQPSDEGARPSKRRRKNDRSIQSSVDKDEEPEQKPAGKYKGRKPSPSPSISSHTEDTEAKRGPARQRTSSPAKNEEKTEQSESEMSVLLDEEPKPKRSRKSATTESKLKNAKGTKGKKAPEQTLDPDLEEIKRLQGWLVKCGIRKRWFKELAPFDKPKAKIKHLKAMLTDAGMSGRYSEAKAEQIKEERELKADLEAVQHGNKLWGQATTAEDPDTGRPKRRLAKGLEELDFLNDDDGEESD